MSTKQSETRVLFVIGSMAGGGAERQVVEYLRHLNRTRFIPLLYLFAREGDLLRDVPPDVQVHAYWDRHRAPRFNFPGRIFRSQARDLASLLDAERVDVVCAVTLLATLVAHAAIRQRPRPLVCVEMSDPRLDFHSTVRRFARFKKRRLKEAYASAQVVAVSEGVRRGIEEFYGVPAARIATVPNFVDLERVDRLAATFDPHFDAGRFHLVSVGRLHPVKGHMHLVRAVDEVVHAQGRNELVLHLIGDGPERAALEEYVHAHELAQHVRFAGFMQNPFPYLKHANLYCLPSLYEGLPLALVEAIACKVPVIATDCPSGPREVLAGGKYGRLVPPGDSAALARAIGEAMDEKRDGAGIADDARRHVEAEYSAQACMPRFERLLVETRT